MERQSRSASSAVVSATLVAVAMIAQQVASKATRDTLFLSEYPATVLPMVMAGSAALSFVIVIALSRLMTRHAPARVVPVVFVVSAALYVGEWALARSQPRLAAVAVYLHTAALGGAVVSSFWSVINERFDPHTAKKVISRIAAGATIGGVLGGAVAWQVGTAVSLPTMLMLLGGANLVCAMGIRFVSNGRSPGHIDPQESRSGFSTLKKMPYLRHLAAIVALMAVSDVVLDYVVKARASESYRTSDELISFFAVFYTIVGVATFLWQSTLAKRFLERVGLTGTVATLPVAYTAGGLLSLAVPGLWSVAGATGLAASLESSLFRSGYELLYTPLAPADKRSTKTIIDVGCARVGSAAGSGLALVVLALVPVALANSVLLGVASVAGGAALMITSLLHRGYVSALADSLLRGSVKLENEEVVDAVTRRTLADTTMALDRQKLLNEIAQLRESGTSMPAIEPKSSTKPAPKPAVSSPRLEDPIVRAIVDLRSGDAAAIRAVLDAGSLAAELVPHVISLLARNDVQRQAIRALRDVADKHAGQLIDALTDPATAFAIRRRLPRVLAHCQSQVAVDGLLTALGDDRFEVRYRCALALARITRENGSLVVPRDRVLKAAQREAEVGEHLWNTQKLLDGDPEDSPTFGEGSSHKLGHSLEYVFTVLSLTLERKPLTLAYHALASDDPNLRGTGLEYLENVLPTELRKVLWPYLKDNRVAKDSKRERRAIVKELEASVSSMTLDRELIARLARGEDPPS